MKAFRLENRNWNVPVPGAGFWNLRLIAVVLLLILQLAGLSSCAAIDRARADLAGLIPTAADVKNDSSASSQDSDNSGISGQSTPSGESGSPDSTKAGQTTTSRLPRKTSPDAAFDLSVTSLIQASLDNYSHQAVLDSAFSGYEFAESQSDELIAHIYKLYEQFFRENPQYYWLDGSARITYSILQTDQPTFSAMTLEMGFGSGFSTASAETLQARQQDLLNEAGRIAQEAEKFNEPWQKLLFIHDTLISNIVYDTTLNQDTNNAASALLEHKTLCQGYAQSFQLIAQDLGFKVMLISGLADNVDHAWNLVWLDGQPYHVDLTHDDPVPDGGSADPVTHVHFLRSDAMMQQTHIWTVEDYPAASVDGAQFYRLQGLVAASRDELESWIGDFVEKANLEDNEAELLELLYSGSDLPGQSTIEDILVQQLRQKSGVRSIVYRASIDKNVISLELLPS